MGAGKRGPHRNGNNGLKNKSRTIPSAQHAVIFMQPGCKRHGGRTSALLPAPSQNGVAGTGPAQALPSPLRTRQPPPPPFTAGQRVSASGCTSPQLDMPWSPASLGSLGQGPEDGSGDKAPRRWGGSLMCAWRGASSPRAAQRPAGSLVEREEDARNLLGKLLWSTWATSKTKMHVNPPSDNTASHFSPGRKKRGEACLKPCIGARNCLKALQNQTSVLSEQHVVALHGIFGIIHPSMRRGQGARGKSCPK